MSKKRIMISIRGISKYLLITLIGFSFLAILTYVYDKFSSKPAVPLSSAQQPAIAKALPTTIVTLPTPTPEISDYRTILLLVRATDLMVKYVDKVKAGEIDASDSSVRLSFLQAFPTAIDAYNHTTPTAGMEHGWKNVMMVAQAYTLVYPVLQQGNMVSNNDLFNMRSSRQWLINYQTTEETLLSSRGVSQDFYNAEKLAAEQLLQENYSGIPLPTAGP